MKATPEFETFQKLYDDGRPQLVWTSFREDLSTPLAAYMKLAEGRPYSFFFESIKDGDKRGRYSIIGLKPDLIWRCKNGHAEINQNARANLEDFLSCDAKPLESLRQLVAECQLDYPKDLPAMASGLFGYMGYDCVRMMEDLPDHNPDLLSVPDSIMFRPSILVVFDNTKDIVTIVTPVWPQAGMDAKCAYNLARERLVDAKTEFGRPLPTRKDRLPAGAVLSDPEINMTKDDFFAMVAKAKDYIAAGDAFQIVGSQRFTVPFPLSSLAFYRSLRRLNPSPYLFLVTLDDFSIIGSSPEILVSLEAGTVTIRPLAGTRKRGASAEEDLALKEDLLADPKERAEHLMLLDLGRNDVGRVCEIGSVKPTKQFEVDYYSHVMHIISNVEGKLRKDLCAMDALIGGFPAGTVSGAPKVRAMEIIDELEPVRRGVYAGAVGYFASNGDMDTCIALRTAVLKNGSLYVQSGVGIVADSDPESEYQESYNKAKALLRAAEDAMEIAADS